LGYTPYEGKEVQGWPETVLLRGHPTIEKGQIVAEAQGEVALVDENDRDIQLVVTFRYGA